MNIIGSPRRVVMFLTAPMMPPTVTVSLSARSASEAEAAGDGAGELLAAVLERVARHVEAEGLLLGGQQLVARHLAQPDRRVELDDAGASPPPLPITAPNSDSWPAAMSLRRRAAAATAAGMRLGHPEAGRAGASRGPRSA